MHLWLIYLVVFTSEATFGSCLDSTCKYIFKLHSSNLSSPLVILGAHYACYYITSWSLCCDYVIISRYIPCYGYLEIILDVTIIYSAFQTYYLHFYMDVSSVHGG